MKYRSSLEQFDQAFGEAKVMSNSVPDGTYQVVIDRAMIKEDGENLYLIWELVVLTNEYKGAKIFKRAQLNNPDRLGFLKTDLDRLQINITKISEIEEHLEKMLDKRVEVKVVTSKPNESRKTYSNCYFVKLIEVSEENYHGFGEEVPF